MSGARMLRRIPISLPVSSREPTTLASPGWETSRTAGGYDPATGSAGSVPQTQEGGPYTLHVVADPVDTPPQVLQSYPGSCRSDGSRADRSDPGILPGHLRDQPVRRSGTGRSVRASRSSTRQARSGRSRSRTTMNPRPRSLTSSTRPCLPVTTSVRLPEQGGLTDLAGLSPVAAGQPPASWASSTLLQREGSSDPLDLGALLPAAATDGVSLDVIAVPRSIGHLPSRGDCAGSVSSFRNSPAAIRLPSRSTVRAWTALSTHGARTTHSSHPGSIRYDSRLRRRILFTSICSSVSPRT